MAGINQIKISELPTKENPSTNDYLVMDDGSETSRIKALTLFNLCYPVGSIYMSVNDTEPSILFGGTWEKIKDRFLLASGDTYSLGATGGEATHKLTINELPNHNHIQRKVASNGEMGYIVNKTKNGDYTGDELGINQVNWYTNKAPVTTESIGGSKPHNNMPPYLVVNIWKRTA